MMVSITEVAATVFRVGKLIGDRYRIEAQIAEGGSGRIHRVLDEQSGCKLALKQLMMRGDSRDARSGAHFEREYHTLSQLAHPCIIEVYDYGVEGGIPYYTMELLEGDELRERHRLGWRESCALLRDVASTLAILHSRRLLHRDVTASNVCYTPSGRAKLIDFGTMMPMGVAKEVVGTPPYVPPEAFQLQSLDGRADLFALGALAYRMLTGRHAYPARSLSQLRDIWSSLPASPRQFEPEVPEALERLVMGLLQLDRAARPSSAAEVMERLSGIAGLPLQELPEVMQAYLVMPTLVGREPLQQRVRAALGRTDGASFLIEGKAGSGRSRFLDACVLEAKLHGAVVLRSDAVTSAGSEYGVARALCRQLIQTQPELAMQHAHAQRGLLAHVISELPTPPGDAPVPERRMLQAALRNWMFSVASSKPIVIAVDDLEHIDEPSAALLGILAYSGGRRPLHVLVTTTTGAAATPALMLLREIAQTLQMQPFSAEESAKLLRSVFGDVPHVAALAERVHALSEGNPGWIMLLCEHLVDHDIARYEAGNWALPSELRPQQLPESLTAAVAERIALLAPDARALAEALALTDPAALAPECYAELTEHLDHGRSYRALEALVAAGVLSMGGERYRFSHDELARTLRAGIAPERARSLHARIARAIEGSSNLTWLPHHMLCGGREREGIAHILARHDSWRGTYSLQDLALLERAISIAEELRLPLHTQLELICVILPVAAALGQHVLFQRYGKLVLEGFERDSGLAAFYELAPGAPARERLAEASRRTQERYDISLEAERGWSPQVAVLRAARLYIAFAAMSSVMQDLQLVERLPSLEPLFPLSPSVSVTQKLVDIQCDLQSGRHASARSKSLEIIARLEQPDAAGMEANAMQALRLTNFYLLGLFAATGGHSKTREYIFELEQLPGHRVNAWRVRMVYELMHGNVEAATQCRRRAELLNLQDGGQLQLPGTTTRVELLAHMYADDLVGVKRCMERIEGLAALYPGWQPTLAIARSHYRRLQGDLNGALLALQPALDGVTAGRHLDWWLIAYTHVQVLDGLERFDEAIEQGRRYIAIWSQVSENSLDYGLRQVVAEALTRAGRNAEALCLIEEYIAMHSASGTRGLRLGLAYETRVRIAIAMRDEAALGRYLKLCAQEFGVGRESTGLVRYSRLVQQAEAAGPRKPDTQPWSAASANSGYYTDAVGTVHSRLLGCAGPSERAEESLQLLLEACGATAGYLLGLRAGRLQQLASTEMGELPTDLRQLLETYVNAASGADDVATAVDDAEDPTRAQQHWIDASGRVFEPLSLASESNGETVLVAIAALQYGGEQRRSVRRAFLEAVADGLNADALAALAPVA